MDNKKLVVYYSRSGTTRRVAETIAAKLKCDVEGIQDVRSRKGLFGWLRSGREAGRRTLPEIRPTVEDPGQYDLVVLATPVWASSMSSPFRTYVTQNLGKFKRLAFLVTFGGRGFEQTLAGIKELCGQEPVATLTLRTNEVRKGSHTQAVEEFVAKLSG
jgi:flavodoxin